MNHPGTFIGVADTRMHPTHFLGKKQNLLFHDPSTNNIEALSIVDDAAKSWHGWTNEVTTAHVAGLPYKESQEFTPEIDKELFRRSLETRAACADRVDLTLLINTLGGTRWASFFFSDLASFVRETGGQVRAYVTSTAVSTGFILAQMADRLQAHPKAFLAHHTGSPAPGTRESYVQRLGEEEAERRMAKLTSIARNNYEEIMGRCLKRALPLARQSIQKTFDDAEAASPDRWASFDGDTLFDAGIVDVLADKTRGILREVAEDTHRSPDELLAIPSLRRFFEHSRIEGKLRRLYGLQGCNIRYDGRSTPSVAPNNEIFQTMDRSLLTQAQRSLKDELLQ